MFDRYYGYPPYVPVAQRQANARKEMEKLKKKGLNVQPVKIEGRKIVKTFWGNAWCEHLDKFSDYANRMPRGRSYVKNGSVVHLDISAGKIQAYVAGTELYKVDITIQNLPPQQWKEVKSDCQGQISSLLDLLQGKLSKGVMSIVTHSHTGLFPAPKEIKMKCSCPDSARMCKHLAAVMYGVGARFDEKPELLFKLRGVDHTELIAGQVDLATSATGKKSAKSKHLADDQLTDLFGIEMAETPPAEKPTVKKSRTVKKPAASSTQIEKTPVAHKRPAANPTFTGKAVSKLRDKLEMTQSQFAQLLSISPATVSNWENHSGRLKLQARNLESLASLKQLSYEEAWELVENS